MYYRDHGPPHFHAIYGEFEITVEIESGVVSGEFSRRALAHVQEWRNIRKSELMSDWNLAQHKQPLKKIEPLE